MDISDLFGLFGQDIINQFCSPHDQLTMFQIYSQSNDQLGEGQEEKSAAGGVPWDQGGRGQQQQGGPWWHQ